MPIDVSAAVIANHPLSADYNVLALAAPATPVREKARPSSARKATLLIPRPFSESSSGNASLADEAPANTAARPQPQAAPFREPLESRLRSEPAQHDPLESRSEPAPYRDALESIREEIAEGGH